MGKRLNSYPQKLSTGHELRNKLSISRSATRLFTQHLTAVLPFALSREPLWRVRSSRVRRLRPVLCLAVGSLALTVQPAQASNIDHYKLYAHSRIINYEQYQCFSKIIYKESRWNPTAVNGSHYGLGQMKSKHYRNLDPYRQIDSTIAYITKRYKSMCNAYRFHIKNGHY